MSDWAFLEKHRVSKPTPGIPEQYITDSRFGFCGMFRFWMDGNMIRCIASDGLGWKHVSVSIERDKRPPKWDLMCKLKDLFWEPEDWVVQFHPAHSEYVNMHPGCLHLWQSTEAVMPHPNSLLVGYK